MRELTRVWMDFGVSTLAWKIKFGSISYQWCLMLIMILSDHPVQCTVVQFTLRIPWFVSLGTGGVRPRQSVPWHETPGTHFFEFYRVSGKSNIHHLISYPTLLFPTLRTLETCFPGMISDFLRYGPGSHNWNAGLTIDNIWLSSYLLM